MSAGGKKVYYKDSKKELCDRIPLIYSPVPKIKKETSEANQRQYYTGPNGGTYYLNDKGKKFYGKPPENASNLVPALTEMKVVAPSSVTTPSTGSQSREILTGPRGGQYYYNSHGNKAYIKK